MKKDVQEKLKKDLRWFCDQAFENAVRKTIDKKAMEVAEELNESLNGTLESLGLVCKVSVGSGNTADQQGIAFMRKDTLGKEYVNGETPSPTRGIYLWFCYDKKAKPEKRLYLEFGYSWDDDYVPCEAFRRLEHDGKLKRGEWKGEHKAYPDFENHKDAILEDFSNFVSHYKSFDARDFKLENMNIIELNNNCYGLEIPLQNSGVKFKNCKLPYNELTKTELEVFTEDMYIAWRVGISNVSKCMHECCQKGIFKQGYINDTREYLEQHNKKYDFGHVPICVLIADTRKEIQTSDKVDYFFPVPYSCDGKHSHPALSNAKGSHPALKPPHLFWLELQPKGKGFEKYMCFSVNILKSNNNEALLNQETNTQYAILALDENYGYIPMETYKFFGALNDNRKIRQFMLSILNNS